MGKIRGWYFEKSGAKIKKESGKGRCSS